MSEGSTYRCRQCGTTYSEAEYRANRFCRKDGTWLSRIPVPRQRSPTLVISTRAVPPLRGHPSEVRVNVDGHVAYFLGVLLSRGAVQNDTLIIRVPCNSENALAHRDFVVESFIPRVRQAAGENVELIRGSWSSHSYEVVLKNDYFLKLLRSMAIPNGEVCRTIGAPQELFGAPAEVQREFIRGIGDCAGEVDRYIDRSPRALLRFLNENVALLEDVVEILLRLGVDIFDVNLSPAPYRGQLSQMIDQLEGALRSTYHVKVTGRLENIGRDHLVRIRAEEYYNKIGGYYNRFRQEKLEQYLSS